MTTLNLLLTPKQCVYHGPPADPCLKKNLIGRQLKDGRSRTPHVHCEAVLLQPCQGK